jgi:electron transfer flavoprotein beta subunit
LLYISLLSSLKGNQEIDEYRRLYQTNARQQFRRFIQILNLADACAVEAAVRLKEQLGGSIMAITLGPRDAEGALRAALAIGADTALRLWNPQASNWGPFTIAASLAACIQREAPEVDLVLCGDTSSDWSSGIVGPALAERLDLPQITGVMQLNVVSEQEQDTVKLQVTRKLERGYRERLEANVFIRLYQRTCLPYKLQFP